MSLERLGLWLEQRYGALAARPAGLRAGLATAERGKPVIGQLLQHRSVRSYLPRAVPPGTVELLVAAAQSAASSSNLQLWSVIVVEDPARRRPLYEVAGKQAHILDCPLFLVWVADLHRPRQLARERGLPSEGLGYLEMSLMASVDTALAAQNAVIAAESLGLGTVYIGALRDQPERVAEVLGLPEGSYAVFGLCVGWPDPERPAAIKPRLPQSVVVHHDRYRPEQAVAGAPAYDATMRRFYESERMEVPGGSWTAHSAQRVASAAALRGRDVLRKTLTKLGLGLQ